MHFELETALNKNVVHAVSDIRPDKAVRAQEFADARKADLAWVLERKAQFVSTPCPACACENSSVAFTKEGFTFERCAECQTLYMRSRLPEKLLGEFYAQSKVMEYFGRVIFPQSYQSRIDRIYLPRLERLLALVHSFSAPTGHFVEVGAGSGVFLELLQQKQIFKDITAIEPSRSLAEECTRRGLKTIAKPIEEVHGILADVVASFEVIEHLFSPYDYLKSVNSILGKGGFCFVTTPNSLSFEVLELDIASTTVGMNHINLFTPSAIDKLAERTGFEVVQILTPGILDVDLVKQGYGLLGGKGGSPFIKYLVSEAPESTKAHFQDFLVNNNLSSHMWAVLRKK